MGRNPLPPDELKVAFNARLSPAAKKRLEEYLLRRGIRQWKPISEGQFLEDFIMKLRLPKNVTQEQIEKFLAEFPPKNKKAGNMKRLESPHGG